MKTTENFNVVRCDGNWIVDSTIIPKNSNDIDSSVELKNFKFYIAKSGDLLISRREIVKETAELTKDNDSIVDFLTLDKESDIIISERVILCLK